MLYLNIWRLHNVIAMAVIVLATVVIKSKYKSRAEEVYYQDTQTMEEEFDTSGLMITTTTFKDPQLTLPQHPVPTESEAIGLRRGYSYVEGVSQRYEDTSNTVGVVVFDKVAHKRRVEERKEQALLLPEWSSDDSADEDPQPVIVKKLRPLDIVLTIPRHMLLDTSTIFIKIEDIDPHV